ncbi:MAG: ABC transporter substrate-binding protein [Pirellulaceae bacterium]|jgi:ABC-type nitrate/sulfonate/bicarbonate transport system substrate-binding protein|nr:ABC transporter substrate-binding protein [Pirellulaceae bacterium]MDP7304301.1 ABC transporter substrate-binding protein [Pirellulaceae bacterium]
MQNETFNKQIDRRSFLTRSAAITGGAALTTSFAIRPSKAALKKVNFITPWSYLIGFAPVLNAHSGGHFKRHGLEVTILGGKGSGMAVRQVLTDRVQFARAASLAMVKAVGNEGAELVAIGTILQQSPFYVVSSKKDPINSAKDMVGKVIGVVARGSGSENTLDMILASAGIKPDMVRREVAGNGVGGFGLIEQGRIAAYVPSLGTVIRLRAASENVVAWNTDKFITMPGQIYLTSKQHIKRDPESCVQFLRAIKDSTTELKSGSPAKLRDRMAKDFDILGIKDLDFTLKAMLAEMELWTASSSPNILQNDPKRWEAMRAGMAGAGLTKLVDAKVLYTNKFYDKI